MIRNEKNQIQLTYQDVHHRNFSSGKKLKIVLIFENREIINKIRLDTEQNSIIAIKNWFQKILITENTHKMLKKI